MRSVLIFMLCSSFIMPVFSQVQQNAVTNSPGKPNTYAIVVGISSYLQKEIPQLQFADKDAEEFAKYLKSKSGGAVPEENITLLVDSAATTGAVYDAIYDLSKTCKQGDLVYFYFSGHGDLENATMYKNGFLICYDSPPNNYVKLSLSIDYLNDIANTLSSQTNANVVLITDACHSGKLAGSMFKGNFLVGDQLRAVRDKEIRITSSSANQLSNENLAWGGGRGVFSYYLINGLKGMADQQKDGIVTMDEIRNYLDAELAKDPVLKRDNIVQTPVLNGNGNFQLAKVDAGALKETQMVMSVSMDNVSMEAPVNVESIPANAQQYFFSLLKKENLEEIINILPLEEAPVENIALGIINYLIYKTDSDAGKNKLKELISTLQANPALLKKFNSKLAVAFDEPGQKVIDQYLVGDAAELERRRYYNSNNNGYDIYPKLFSIAAKLTQPDSYLYNILQVKLHYFTGVALRLKMPTVEDALPLIDSALAEQKKALALEEHAAYIYNELGVLYFMKKEYEQAEKYFLQAAQLSPDWVVPPANLVGLYASTRAFDKGVAATEKAKALDPGLLCIYVNSGYLYENKGDQLMAEELYRKSIHINSRHYSPFERLGYVYMNTTHYALADSFFHEADIRKQGFHFIPGVNMMDKEAISPIIYAPAFCAVDSNNVGTNDILGHFALGVNASESFGPITADGVLSINRRKGVISSRDMETAEREFRKVIALDKHNPLAFHYLGKILYWQQRWQEADIVFNLALQNHLDKNAFDHYLDSMKRSLRNGPSKDCIVKVFSEFRYAKTEDHYFLAAFYEDWKHYTEAELHYRAIISIDSLSMGAYYKLWNLLENLGRYKDAEEVIRRFMANNRYKKAGERELYAFYKRMLDRFPNDAELNYKTGIFLYHLAADNPDDYPIDKKTVTPDTHEEYFHEWASDHYNTFMMPGPGEYDMNQGAPFINFPRDNGIACLLKADSLSTFPDEAVADINDKLGDLYAWQGLGERAIPHYLKSLNLQPKNSGVRMKLIDVYDSTSHFQDALVQLDSLGKRGGSNFSKQLLQAKYFIHSGRFAEAQTLLTAAEKIYPYTLPEIIDLDGRLQLMSGHDAVAMGYYKKLLAIDSNNNSVRYTLARLYAKQGNKEEAWKWLEAAATKGFKYSFVLAYDSYLEDLRNTARWPSFEARIKELSKNKGQPIHRRVSEGY